MTARFDKLARRAAVLLLVVAVVAGLAPVARPAEAQRRERDIFFQDETAVLSDSDARVGRIVPSDKQRQMVRSLNGTVRWNEFGTPISLIAYDGYLDTGLSGDPAQAALRWVTSHRELFRLSTGDLAGLTLQHVLPLGDEAWVVQFRQTFSGVPAVVDGRITLGITRGRLAYVSSSAAPGSAFRTDPALQPAEALLQAGRDVGFGFSAADMSALQRDKDWFLFELSGVSEPGRARLRALPTPTQGIRLVYETLLIDTDHEHGHPEAWVHMVDAVTGQVWRRESRIQFERAPEPPLWSVYPNTPPLNYNDKGKRSVWCWKDRGGCDRGLKNKAALGEWDTIPGSGPTFSTSGNAARSAQSWISPFTPGEQYQPVSPDRRYNFPFTNQWLESGCSPAAFATPQRVDVDAATANLFAMHNRMHDWSYELGFTEAAYNLQVVNRDDGQSNAEGGDPEVGNSQAGAITGTSSPLVGRDNANQITPPDGVAPITNMYLWQPIGAAFYPPCVDGDYDMAVIGHEYTHAISNRMVGGPDSGLSGPQAGAMGESWSDLVAVEYLNQYGFAPVGKENPFSVGAYVTGDPDTAVRNYGMNRSPLNYSDIAYDFVGQQVHADGEIWSATNFQIREALNRRYDSRFPSSDRAVQRACADGERRADACPGNRRWIQIVFDAFLLMESRVSMLDARDAYLAADKMRFDAANQALLWREFAQRGFGKGAKSATNTDPQPQPSFEDPRGSNGKVTFRVTGEGKAIDAQVFVGDYEARVTPIVSANDDSETMATGTYDFVTQAAGFGMKRFRASIGSGPQTVEVHMPKNLASASNGAKARGDGEAHNALIDDTETTNWVSDEGATVKGKQVTVDLAGGEHTVDSVNVSAMLNDSGGQNRFSALRQFAIEVCSGKCSSGDDFRRIYTSRANAFPSVPPRPKAPHLILRSFDLPDAKATHVRLVVLTNQCTGVKEFKKESDNDTTKKSTCLVGYPPAIPGQGNIVRAAELQVFVR